VISVILRIDEITAEAREVSFLQSEDEVNRRLRRGPVDEFRVGCFSKAG